MIGGLSPDTSRGSRTKVASGALATASSTCWGSLTCWWVIGGSVDVSTCGTPSTAASAVGERLSVSIFDKFVETW